MAMADKAETTPTLQQNPQRIADLTTSLSATLDPKI